MGVFDIGRLCPMPVIDLHGNSTESLFVANVVYELPDQEGIQDGGGYLHLRKSILSILITYK